MARTERNPRGISSAKQTTPPRLSAGFIEPMLLLKTDSLPDDSRWLYELKLDGYRAIAFKRNGTVHLRSRNDNDFDVRYPGVVKALANMPNDTVIDGEVVAFDQDGRPSFNALQNFGSAPAPVVYYVFDIMVLAGHNVMREPLEKRRELLEKKVLPKLREPVRYSAPLTATLSVLIESVKVHGFEVCSPLPKVPVLSRLIGVCRARRHGHAGGKGRLGGEAKVMRLPSGSRTCANVEYSP